MDFVLWKTKNTKKKNTIILCSMNFLFWKARRDKWTNDSSALKKFLNEFLITVRKKEHNEEYEPNSLQTFFASF